MQFETPRDEHIITVRYVGNSKLEAVKTLRAVFGIGLRAAKDCVEHPAGFNLTHRDFGLLITVYRDSKWDWTTVEAKPFDLVR